MRSRTFTLLCYLIVCSAPSSSGSISSNSCIDQRGTIYPTMPSDGYIAITYEYQREGKKRRALSVNLTDDSTISTVGTTAETNQEGSLITCDYTRAFIPLDTSAVPDPAHITAASLWIYIPAGAIKGTPTIRVVRTDQADTSSLEVWDFSQCEYSYTSGRYRDSAVRGMSGDIVHLHEGWNEIPLNSEGIAWINKFGETAFGLREVEYDCAEKCPENSQEHTVAFFSSRGATPPYLSISYSLEPGGHRYTIDSASDLYCEKNNAADGSAVNGVPVAITANPSFEGSLQELEGERHASSVNDDSDNSFVFVRNSAKEVSGLFGFERTFGGGQINAVTINYKYRAGKSGKRAPTGNAIIRFQSKGKVYRGDALDLETDGDWHTASFTWNMHPGTRRAWRWDNILGTAFATYLEGGVRFECAKSSHDDFVECSKIWMVIDVNELLLGRDANGSRWDAALRFDARKLAQGDTVEYARVLLPLSKVQLADSDTLRFTISGEDADSSKNFSAGPPPSQRTTTAASVLWDIDAGELPEDIIHHVSPYPLATPDISTIINEILARPHWSEQCQNRGITILIDERGSPANNYLNVVNFRKLFEGYALEIYETVRDCIIAKEIVGRVTDTSAVINCISLIPLDMKVEYTLASDTQWERSTTSGGVTVRSPRYGDYHVVEETLSNLSPNAHYKYRILFRKHGVGKFITSDEVHTFYTQRSEGSSFVFIIEADSHIPFFVSETSSTDFTNCIPYSPWFMQLYQSGIQAIDNEDADFHINLGDWGSGEYTVGITKEAAMLRYIRFRQYQGTRAWPMYFVLGNHEGENPARYKDLYPDNMGEGRKNVIPNPTRDGGEVERFYKNPGNRDSYYAWEWGNALFIVLDPFGYNKKNIDADAWNWTLGEAQYNWLWNVLARSKKRFKFVFTHHLVGGRPQEEWNYGKGGIEYVKHSVAGNPTFEWGGENEAGEYEYTSGGRRDTAGGQWTHGSIHEMFTAHFVTAVFKGHDHVYVEQELDGIKYITCPTLGRGSSRDAMYGDVGGFYKAGDYSKGTKVNNYGYIRVAVDPDAVTMSYIGNIRDVDINDSNFATYQQGEVRRSFSIKPSDSDENGDSGLQ